MSQPPTSRPLEDQTDDDDGARFLVFRTGARTSQEDEDKPKYRHQLPAGEPLAVALRRVAVDELTRALHSLESEDRVEAIHKARKSLKRTRAMLRLVRDRMGDDEYRKDNGELRDAARLFSELRSAHVMARTAEAMSATVPVVMAPARSAALASRLDARHDRMQSEILGDQQSRAEVAKAIVTVRRRIAQWTPAYPTERGRVDIPDDFSSVAHGIRRVYRRGRRAMERAAAAESAEAYHEWRKRVKYLRYQIEVLHLMWPEVLGELAEQLAALAETLGDEHDLAELAEIVESDHHLLPDPDDRAALRTWAYDRRLQYQAEARSIGARLYAETPNAFVERLDVYWTAWRVDKPPLAAR